MTPMQNLQSLSDNELSLTVELNQTRLGLLQQSVRACEKEMQLAQAAGIETRTALQALMVEQERRAAEKKAEAKPADAA